MALKAEQRKSLDTSRAEEEEATAAIGAAPGEAGSGSGSAGVQCSTWAEVVSGAEDKQDKLKALKERERLKAYKEGAERIVSEFFLSMNVGEVAAQLGELDAVCGGDKVCT